MGSSWISGWHFTAVLDDALVDAWDEGLDELRKNLAVSEGIKVLLCEDRKAFYLKADDLDSSEVNEALERTDTDG